MSLQDNGGLAMTCALNELYGVGYDYVFGTPSRFRALSAEAIREAAASILKPERRAVSLVFPEKNMAEQEEAK
jgi:predicted Zn-dependent peptidase